MLGAVGAAVGVLGWALKAAIEAVAGLKYRAVTWLLARAGLGAAWAFSLAFSVALAAAAAWPVVAVAPQAAGAGVAEVMAYLNGCAMPKARQKGEMG